MSKRPDAADSALYLVGPTGVGKSDVAIALAEQLGGEIVGADAFQVYRGLDRLTAKPAPDDLARVPHHLIGEIPLPAQFDVAQYRTLALERIAEIVARGKVPLVVGGTGLYVRALTHGLADLPSSDPVLRAQLETRPLEDLLAEFDQLDPVGARQIDRRNPRRVIRALEVCLLTGKPFSSFREQTAPLTPIRAVFLVRERDDLYARIDRRTHKMFAEGVVEEVRDAGPLGPTSAQAIGVREIQQLLRGEIAREACIQAIQQQTRHYAKRQMTWFRRETHFMPIEIGRDETLASLTARVHGRFAEPQFTN